MKRILFYMTCFAALLLQACNNEVDDLFDQSAQERMDEELRICQELLVGAENGWILEYYPQSKQEYGGYCMTVKFDGLNVTAASEITGDPTYTVSSLYSLKSDVGPTLNFDSYNEILHFFADPDYSLGAGLGAGYEGDYEFTIMSHTDNEIVLQGKKTKNRMHMYKLEESSESYLTKVLAITNAMEPQIDKFESTVNGQQVTVLPEDRQITIQVGEESQTMAYMYTDQGLRLYEALDVNGTEVTDIAWSDDQRTFVYEGQPLTPVISPYYEPYMGLGGDYIMRYTNNNNVVKEIPIKVSANNFRQRFYTVEGLPFTLPLYYNDANNCFEIIATDYGTYYVAIWEIIGNGSLTWGGGIGLFGVTKVNEETQESYYSFEDNGVWGDHVGRAIILWSAGGEYTGFGGDTRYMYIEFHKP